MESNGNQIHKLRWENDKNQQTQGQGGAQDVPRQKTKKFEESPDSKKDLRAKQITWKRIYRFKQKSKLSSCFGSPDLGTTVSLHDFSKGLTWFCLYPNSSSTPPTCPFIVRHLSSRFCTPDTLAIPGLHYPKYWCSRPWVRSRGLLASSVIFHRSFLSANSSLICLLCCLIYLGSLFNGPLYIPVVSLALLTEGRTARDLLKQRWSKKNQTKIQVNTLPYRKFPAQSSKDATVYYQMDAWKENPQIQTKTKLTQKEEAAVSYLWKYSLSTVART